MLKTWKQRWQRVLCLICHRKSIQIQGSSILSQNQVSVRPKLNEFLSLLTSYALFQGNSKRTAHVLERSRTLSLCKSEMVSVGSTYPLEFCEALLLLSNRTEIFHGGLVVDAVGLVGGNRRRPFRELKKGDSPFLPSPTSLWSTQF